MDLGRTLTLVANAFLAEQIPFGLIGGMALSALGVPRATGDIDFLVDGTRAQDADRLLTGHRYRAIHRSAEAANYVPDDLALCRVDILFANRPPSRAMLHRALPHSLHGTPGLPVVQAEDVIGLKVQASSTDPRRTMIDLVDVERLIAARPTLDLVRVREYFAVFEREAELDAMLARLGRA